MGLTMRGRSDIVALTIKSIDANKRLSEKVVIHTKWEDGYHDRYRIEFRS